MTFFYQFCVLRFCRRFVQALRDSIKLKKRALTSRGPFLIVHEYFSANCHHLKIPLSLGKFSEFYGFMVLLVSVTISSSLGHVSKTNCLPYWRAFLYVFTT